MKNKKALRHSVPLLVVFIISSTFFLTAQSLLDKWNIDPNVMIIGNLILFAATAVSFYFYFKSIHNNQPHVFLRMIYTGMIIKMFLCLLASFIYISMAGKEVNKGAIFGCMFLYLFYTFMEAAILMKISKEKKNA